MKSGYEVKVDTGLGRIVTVYVEAENNADAEKLALDKLQEKYKTEYKNSEYEARKARANIAMLKRKAIMGML